MNRRRSTNNLGTTPPSKGKEVYRRRGKWGSPKIITRATDILECLYILVLLPHLVKAKRNIRHYANKDEEASGAVV